MNAYTPTEYKLLAKLEDGYPHTREELLGCLESMNRLNNLQVHICNIRRKLEMQGLSVVCESRPKICYRMVKLVGLAAGLGVKQ